MRRFCRTAILLLSLMLLLLSLASCMVIPKTYHPVKKGQKVKSISIITMPEGEYFDIWSMESLNDFEEKGYSIVAVPEEELDDFVKGFEKLPFTIFILLAPIPMDPNFDFYGTVVLFTYEDGGALLVSPHGVQDYISADGKGATTHENCDEKAWNDFLAPYLAAVETN